MKKTERGMTAGDGVTAGAVIAGTPPGIAFFGDVDSGPHWFCQYRLHLHGV